MSGYLVIRTRQILQQLRLLPLRKLGLLRMTLKSQSLIAGLKIERAFAIRHIPMAKSKTCQKLGDCVAHSPHSAQQGEGG